jgi:hypothetical protein
MTSLDNAIVGLEQVLDYPRRHQAWRAIARQRIIGIRDALLRETARGGDGWLAPRARTLNDERRNLVTQLSALGAQLAQVSDVEPIRAELQRLVNKLQHHSRKMTDYAYDTVSLELGGSE